VWVTGTQEVEAEVAAPPTGGGGTGAGTTTEAEGAGGDAEAGKKVFLTAGCTACHTLADAGATGQVGPNLDQLKPTAAMVAAIVPNGRGAMPAFGDKLSTTDIKNVAAYVSSVAGK